MRYSSFLLAAMVATTAATVPTGNLPCSAGMPLSPVCKNGFSVAASTKTFHAVGDVPGTGQTTEQIYMTSADIKTYVDSLPASGNWDNLPTGVYDIPGFCQASTTLSGAAPSAIVDGAAVPAPGHSALNANNAKIHICHNGHDQTISLDSITNFLGQRGDGHDYDRVFGAGNAPCDADCDEDEEYEASPSPSPASECAECAPCTCCYDPRTGVKTGCQNSRTGPFGTICLPCGEGDQEDPKSPSPTCEYPPGEILDTFCPNLDILYSCGICNVDETLSCDGIVTNTCPGYSPEEIEDYCTKENFSCNRP